MNSSLATSETAPQHHIPAISGLHVAKCVAWHTSFSSEQDGQLDILTHHAQAIDTQPPLSPSEVVKSASSHIHAQARDHIAAAHSDLTASTLANYCPDDSSDVMSPNQYLKREGLDSSYKPWLRKAHATAIEESRKRLREKARSTELPNPTSICPDLEQLEVEVVQYMRELSDEIPDSIKRFQTASTSRPDYMAMQSGSRARYREEKIRLIKEHADKTPEQRKKELDAIGAINNALFKYLQRKTLTVQQVAGMHMPDIKQIVEAELRAQFARLPADEVASLKHELETAYRQAVREKEADDAIQAARR